MSHFLQFLGPNVTSSLLHPIVLAILAFIFILLFKWSSTLPNNNKNSPPSAPKLPIIGNFHQLGLYPHHSLRDLAQLYGPLMLLKLGNVPTLVVSSADAAREIMTTNDVIFANRPKTRMFGKLTYNFKDVALAPYGEYWRQTKSILVLHLLSNKRVQSFRAVREEEISLLIEKIKQSCSSSSVNLSEMFAKLTNDIICRVALGRKYGEGEGGRKFKELIGEMMELLGVNNMGDYIPWLAWVNRINGLDAKAERVAKQFDDFLEGVIEEHINRKKKGSEDHSLENEDQKDFVDVLLWVQKENMIGSPIDRVCIKALILDAFNAGTDTTYSVLEWAMTELLRHPKMMKKMQDEVRAITSNKKDITLDDLDEIHYLNAVIKETLRLHPILPLLIPRESSTEAKIQGYDIAAGTQVFINVWAIGRDPGLWDNPEEFYPERFLNSSIDFKGHDFQLIPFGAGRRSCPGISFAITNIKFVLAKFVKYFDWTLPNGARGDDLDMTESIGIAIHKKFPLIAVATPYVA
ncbi:cytochrome P450 736A117-like [Castanea sativa]|uniref:cytochrome P450 736A117-like n=1 Tax=Castanea sativa TaxID=21020 RepID=UPI003F6516B0